MEQPISHIEIPTTSAQPIMSNQTKQQQPTTTNGDFQMSSYQIPPNFNPGVSQYQPTNQLQLFTSATNNFPPQQPPPMSQYTTTAYSYVPLQQMQFQFPQVSMPITTGHDPNLTIVRPPPTNPIINRSQHTTAIKTPITTTISRTNTPVGDPNKQYQKEDEVSFINDTLNMASGLAGSISTIKKNQIIDALTRALRLLAENMELKEQLITASKRKRNDDDMDPRDVMMDDDNDFVTKTEMKQYFGDIKRSINSLYTVMHQHKNNDTTSNNNKQNKPVSFAEILKETRDTATPKHQTVVYIPENEDTAVTRQTLARLIQPAKEGIDMTDAKSLSKGKMIIDFKDQASKSKFDLLAKATKQLATEPPRKLTPTILLKGVRRDIDKKEIPTMLNSFNFPIAYYVETNNLDINKLVEVVSERKNFRSERLINYSLSVDPKIREIIINELNGKIILDYSLVHAEDASPLRQCFRCLGYNHKATMCQLKPEQQVCFHCGLQHKFDNCPNKTFPPTCVNCLKLVQYILKCFTEWQTKFNTCTMDKENRPIAQQEYIKIAQINCNKSPSALQQFLSFCDKLKIDIALISEPPIRKNIPNIDKKYRPMYATNLAISSISTIHQSSNNNSTFSANHVFSAPQVTNNNQMPSNQQMLNSQQVPNNNHMPRIVHHPPSSAQQVHYGLVPNNQQSHVQQIAAVHQSQIMQLNPSIINKQTHQHPIIPVRSCIVILNPLISPIIISSVSNVDFLVIEINNFVIASVYSQPVGPIDTTIKDLDNLTVYARDKRMLIGGDFNAKSSFWGPLNDDRGEQLLSAIIHNDLTVLNDGIKPTFDTTRGNQRLISYIDLTIVSQNILDNISEWSVRDDIYNSDHRPILTTINNADITSTASRTTVRWNTNNVDWPAWSAAVSDKLSEFNISDSEINIIDDQQQLDLTITMFTNVIQLCCDNFCTKYIDKRARSGNWHKDTQLQQIVTKQRQIYRKIRRCHNQLALQRYQQIYQQLRHQYRTHLQKLKSDAFNKDINGDGPVNCFQRVSRLIKNSGHMIFKTIEGTSDPVESTIKLVDTLFPNDDPNNDSDDQKSTRIYINRWLQKNNNLSAPPPITIQELHNAIIKFKDGKAPGYDGSLAKNSEKFMALASNDNVALISLDIRGAFDHAWHPSIIQRLIDYRTPKYLIKMMANYQKDRRICVNHGGVSCYKETNRGVVQGSMLGPLNWNIVINDFLTKNLGDDTRMQAYADDIAIVVSSKCKTYLPIKINNILKMAFEWGQKSKLTFSEAKTQIMYVTRRINRPIYSPVAMNNIVIKPVEQMKILGVIFDHRLDFRPHVHHAAHKAINTYRLVNGIARKTYGLSPQVLQLIHHSIIEPIITYGAVVTRRATRYQHVINFLRQLLKPLAQKATKAYRTAPIVATSAIADFPPFELLINFRATIVESRVTKCYNHLGVDIPVDIEEAQEPATKCAITFIVREPTAITPARIFIKSILTNRGIGTAFMAFINDNRLTTKSYRLPNYGTLQQADLFAIKMAIDWTRTNLGHRTTYIVTNNIGTVDRDSEHYRKLKQVARRTGKHRNRSYDYDHIHLKVVKKIEYRNMLSKWDDKYKNDRFGTNIKKICQHVGDARQFSKEINRFLTHTLTGHGQFGSYLARFGISNDIGCVCGFPVQDVPHLINDCPMSNLERRRHGTTNFAYRNTNNIGTTDHVQSNQATTTNNNKWRLSNVIVSNPAKLQSCLNPVLRNKWRLITLLQHHNYNNKIRSCINMVSQLSPQFSNTSVPTSFNPGLFYSQNAAATSAAPASFNFLPPTTNIATTATTTPITTSISRSATPVNNMPSANNNVEFLKETLKMASKLGGNITTARKEAVVDALNLALSLSQENNVLKEQLTNAYKRRRTDTDLCSRDDPMDDDDSNYVTKAELKSYLDDIKNSINNLSNIISKQSNKATSNKQNPPLTFAEIIKENKKSSTPKHQTVVFLPDNEDTLVTRQTLSKLIHPAKEGIAMTDAKSLSKGKMIINFKDKASKSKFESLAKATKKINTEPPRKLRPSIMLKGVRIEVKKEDIPSMFAAFNYPIAYYVETNKLDITKLMEVVSDRKNFRSEYLINYVISIDPAIRDLVINEMNGKVILDYALVHAEDMSPLRQCYRCYGFNHIANTCQLPPEQQICHHCALTHKYELCPNKACAPRCVNCRKTVLINHARFTSECYNVWQTKLNIITMNNQRQSRSQLDTTKIAQINCKSPSALNQFLNFCDKNKVDIAMITEPPIRKGVPNISRKFKPLYATNHYSSDHHPNTHQQNQLHVSVPNVQLPSSFQPYVQQVSAMQHVPSAGLGPINHSISNHRSASNNQQASVNQPNTNNQQVSSVLQPPLNQQPSNNPPSSTTQTPVRSCIIIFNPSLSPITISSVSNTDFITIEINNFVFASDYSQPPSELCLHLFTGGQPLSIVEITATSYANIAIFTDCHRTTRINRAVTGIARKSHGLSPQVLRMIYHSITEPILSYGALITGRAVKYQHIQKILRQMVTPMAQQAVKAYRSSSYISVTALADFPPIELFIGFRAAIATARTTGQYKYNDLPITVDINDDLNNNTTSKITTIIKEPSASPPFRIIIKSIKTTMGVGAAFMIFNNENIIGVKHYRLPPIV
ncbi:hypothetical protein DERF_002678 [Dermatophagoides farinae]|uniref:Reverse transcriptase domain-containing protein n=1 Tax=Dermatophagoides farinae TaxID=6954 RepID=A0A922IDD1_DERFA|nr:hypothetical protein DERF_002678 [Dermatophagoides farinae]